ncbi:DNRLRE domain-containing protein [Nocardiopsis xinjiangensis]|uniref:DNRLRE domain-containing protein n=1 Tax=Nocardiopsis xinjiangensis TaxID=124285 RepID=UPI00037AC42E|nr:DNRLRE domain-containing protein [Nocardiopsis xinjiangensis]
MVEGDPDGSSSDADVPDEALPREWPDLPEDADPMRPPGLEGTEAPAQPEEDEPDVSGFDEDTSEEAVDEREEFSRTFENEDGTLSTDFSLQPFHFEGANGSWERIDTSLVPENTATWANSADSRDLAFASHADSGELARMELDEHHSLVFSLEDAAGVEGEVLDGDEDSILYEDALPGADIELESLVGGTVKETIWLNEAPKSSEDATWRFPLELEGLTPELLDDGSIDLADSEGESVGHIPAGYMEDSDIDPRSGDGAWSEAVEFALSEEDGQWVLEVTADHDWLTDDARVYPVGVDPTASWNYNVSQDTYVQSGFNTPRHTETELKAGTYDNGSNRAASYLKFSSLVNELRHHKIYGAQLYLFNHWSYSCTPSPVHVHEVTQSWNHRSVSDFPGPSYNSTALGQNSFARGWMPVGASSSSCPARYEGIDLGSRGRDLVQAWVDGDKANHGLTVRASETSSSGWKKFGSRESWGAPYMTVTYSPYRADYSFAQEPPELDPAPHPNRGTSVEVGVTNRGEETWTPDNGYELSYQVFDEDGDRIYHVAPTTPVPSNVATGESVNINAEIDPLPPGTWTIKFDMTHEAQSFAAWGVPMMAQMEVEVPDLPPQLLDYSPRDGARVATLTPEFTASGSNNDAWPTDDMEFWFNFCDGEWPEWECIDSGWQEDTSWELPSDLMEWGNQYWWNVFVRDGSQTTESGWLRLVAEADQPAVNSNLAGAGSDDASGAVDDLIGNYTETVTDAALPVSGPELDVTRTYNSSDPRQNGIFGAGWSTRFDMDLVADVDGTGNVVVTYPDGRQHRFAHEAGGGYAPPSGMHATLARTETGWRLMDKASTSYVFDDSGRLSEVTDHRGRSQTIEYDASGLIAEVVSDAGRSLEFGWKDGRVVSVMAAGGEDSAEWTYAYDEQRLAEACDPEGACTSYTYEEGSHYRAAVMDANPYGFWRFEEDRGDTAADEVPEALGGEPATIVGSGLGVEGALTGVDSGALATGADSYAQLPEAALHRIGTRITAEAWFSTTEHGTVIGAVDRTDSPSESNQIVYVGTDGKLRAQFLTTDADVAPIVTDSAVNDGEWHHAALTSDGTSQVLYLDGAQVGTKEGQVDHRNTKFVYAGHGVAGPEWPATLSSAGDFSFNGIIDEVALYQRPLHPDTVALHHTSGVDAADRLSESVTPEGKTSTRLEFDESTSRVRIHTDRNGGKWVYSEPDYSGSLDDEEPEVLAEVTVADPRAETTSARYDALNGHQRVTDIDQLGYETTYSYDTGGFMAATTSPTGTRTEFANDERGNRLGKMECRDTSAAECSWEWYSYHHNPDDPFDPRNDQLLSYLDPRSEDYLDTTYRTWWAYNEYGDQISETSPGTEDAPDGHSTRYLYTDGTEKAVDGGTVPAGMPAESVDAEGGVTEYAYNSHGDTTRVVEPSGAVTENTYNGLGRLVETTVVSDEFPEGVTTSLTYDGAGRMLTRTGPPVANEITGDEHRHRTTLRYDGDGNPVRSTISDLVGGDPDRVTTWAYNQYGHLVAQTDAQGRTEHYGYDLTGSRTHFQDAAGTMFRTTYTERGHVAERSVEGWTGHPDDVAEPSNLVLESRSYDPDGNLASTTDPAGRTTSFVYYADGLLARTTAAQMMLNHEDEPQDVVLEDNSYDPAGNLVRSVSDGGETRVDRVWSADSQLVEQTLDPEGLARTTTYSYDGRGNTIQSILTDPSGRTERTNNTYDAAGHLVEEAVATDDGALVTTYEVSERGLVTAVTDPRGNEDGAEPSDFTIHTRYDELGRPVEERMPEVTVEHYGATTTDERPTLRYGYNLVGDLTHEEDAEGHTTVSGYDLVGQKTSRQGPSFIGAEGVEVSPEAISEYDALGRVVSHTDPLGNSRTYTWDQLGNLTGSMDPPQEEGTEPGQWSYSYNPVGELLTVVDPLGARTEATYDDLGRQVTETEVERVPAAAAYTTQYTYDVSGNPLSVTDPLGNETAYAYNPAGELERSTAPTGETTRFEHDSAGRPTKTVDPVGNESVSEYDPAGRLVRQSVLDADGEALRTESTRYDAAGEPVERTDALGHTTEFEYDALGRLVSQVEPVSESDSITTTFGYDASGRRTRITDGRGNSTWTTYTPSGQVEDLVEPATDSDSEAVDRTWTTAYDVGLNPVRQHVPGGIVRKRTFDAFGNLTRETAQGAEAETEDRVFGYDLAGRPESVGTPSGDIDIVHDDRGNRVQFLGPGAVSYDGIAPGTTVSYDGAGRVGTRTDMTGTTTFAYDASGRVTEHYDPVTDTELVIDYDEAGRLSSTTTDEGAVRAFDYDALSQLTEDTLVSTEEETGYTTSYDYDAAGRITERSVQGGTDPGTHSYTYDQASRLTSWTSPSDGKTEYGWDDAGNRVSAGSEELEYDERNRLTASSEGNTWSYAPGGTLSSAFVDGELRTPGFDGFGRMVDAGNGSGTYAYDALGRIAERDGSGSETHTFVYPNLSNNPVGILDGTQTPVAQYGRDSEGQLMSVQDGQDAPGLTYSNSHGDLVATHTAAGSVLSTADFDPFGEQRSDSSAASLGYQGEWTDPETGDVNMHARWYQPGSGRFASRDTLTLAPTPSVQSNRYTYANADPVGNTDPSGHFVPIAIGFSFKALVGIGAALSAAVAISSVGAYTAAGGRINISTPSVPDLYRMLPEFKKPKRPRYSRVPRFNIPNWNGGYSGPSYSWGGHRYGSGSSWAYSSARGVTVPPVVRTPGFSGGRYGMYVSGGGSQSTFVPMVDPRRKTLDRILSTPQPRPPIKSLVTQEEVDAQRLEAERGAKIHRTTTMDDLYEEFEFNISPAGVRPVSRREPLPGRVDEANDECVPYTNYGYIDTEDRRSGVVKQFCSPEDLKGGSKPSSAAGVIPGYPTTPKHHPKMPEKKGYAYNKGHLLGRQLGGSGSDARNLVNLHRRANFPVMERYERRVRDSVNSGEDVIYSVRPVYGGGSNTPSFIHVQAIGEDGLRIDSCISNEYEPVALHGVPCVGGG